MWDAALYKSQHAFVFEYGNDLLSWLAPQAGESILDVGCGTGELTAQIATTGAAVIGIDKSADMIESAQAHYPNIQFAVADIVTANLQQQFDAIFSNATLHWVMEKEQAAAQMRRHLKPGGRLVLEMGGLHNVKSITDTLQKVMAERGLNYQPFWYFPSAGRYATILEHQGFRVNRVHYFDRETPLADTENGIVQWLEMFGKQFFGTLPEAEKLSIMHTVQDRLRNTNFRDGKWYADYKRLRVSAERI
ncbi:trans-aconitate methyltransferase [Chitinophaga skermanii]|uniref:Trans-aconitate methyltransferase n=1 Tax=Chitinophaga skermanii TaxID=331697 RepID=A0A327QD51_9BACT|nr:class I SAM-dependent methyltransferase [Chitinophaga skermanii]RAJ02499.1 trans-aconitate methyltransferase [Chitinophaga skermanii]